MRPVYLFVLLLCFSVSSCIGLEYGSSVKDLYGTDWAYKGETASMGLSFSSNGTVLSYIDNQYGVQTVTGTYDYIASTKALAFKGLAWYYANTGNLAFQIISAHILDSKTMKVDIKDFAGTMEEYYFYRQ